MNEAEIQRTVFAHLRTRARADAVFWHTPNDPSSRRKVGYRPGVSDVAILCAGEFFALELKKDGGRPSEEQLKFISDINAAGGFGCVAEGLDEAIGCLSAWGLLR